MATGDSSLLGMECQNPGTSNRGWCQLHREYANRDLFSSGSVRCKMSTGTDWPRLEDPLDHFSELDPSHVQALLEDLEPFCCCHSLKSWTRPIHGCSSWIPNTSTIEVFTSCMYATHSQSCSGQITICLCRSAGFA